MTSNSEHNVSSIYLLVDCLANTIDAFDTQNIDLQPFHDSTLTKSNDALWKDTGYSAPPLFQALDSARRLLSKALGIILSNLFPTSMVSGLQGSHFKTSTILYMTHDDLLVQKILAKLTVPTQMLLSSTYHVFFLCLLHVEDPTPEGIAKFLHPVLRPMWDAFRHNIYLLPNWRNILLLRGFTEQATASPNLQSNISPPACRSPAKCTDIRSKFSSNILKSFLDSLRTETGDKPRLPVDSPIYLLPHSLVEQGIKMKHAEYKLEEARKRYNDAIEIALRNVLASMHTHQRTTAGERGRRASIRYDTGAIQGIIGHLKQDSTIDRMFARLMLPSRLSEDMVGRSDSASDELTHRNATTNTSAQLQPLSRSQLFLVCLYTVSSVEKAASMLHVVVRAGVGFQSKPQTRQQAQTNSPELTASGVAKRTPFKPIQPSSSPTPTNQTHAATQPPHKPSRSKFGPKLASFSLPAVYSHTVVHTFLDTVRQKHALTHPQHYHQPRVLKRKLDRDPESPETLKRLHYDYSSI